jgi:DHA2 family lincomycin resistance protein-like MFS transporter
VAFLALLGSAILLPIYLQNVLHASPLVTGLLVLPGGVLMGVLGPFVGRAYDRFGPRALLLPGAVIGATALALLGLVSETTPLWFVLAAHIALSAGLAAVLTPLFTAGLGAVPMRYTSYGSAIFATVQQVGGAAGTALVVTLLAVQSAAARAAGSSPVQAAASGVRLAFWVAAGVFALTFVLSLFVTRPVSEDRVLVSA